MGIVKRIIAGTIAVAAAKAVLGDASVKKTAKKIVKSVKSDVKSAVSEVAGTAKTKTRKAAKTAKTAKKKTAHAKA